jgi:hypothetical protein
MIPPSEALFLWEVADLDGITENGVNGGWTIATYAIYTEALRAADKELQASNDRRYTEVNIEKEKALKIKETADLAALELARESQKYKEERNDSMREQTITDKGEYATHADVAVVVDMMRKELKPIIEYISSQQGISKGTKTTTGQLYGTIAAISAIVATIFLIGHYLLG